MSDLLNFPGLLYSALAGSMMHSAVKPDCCKESAEAQLAISACIEVKLAADTTHILGEAPEHGMVGFQ